MRILARVRIEMSGRVAMERIRNPEKRGGNLSWATTLVPVLHPVVGERVAAFLRLPFAFRVSNRGLNGGKGAAPS